MDIHSNIEATEKTWLIRKYEKVTAAGSTFKTRVWKSRIRSDTLKESRRAYDRFSGFLSLIILFDRWQRVSTRTVYTSRIRRSHVAVAADGSWNAVWQQFERNNSQYRDCSYTHRSSSRILFASKWREERRRYAVWIGQNCIVLVGIVAVDKLE